MARSKLFSSMVPGRATEMGHRAVGKIWPNGEFSLGYVPEGEDVDAYGRDYMSAEAQRADGDVLDVLLQDRDLWEDELWAPDSLHGLPCGGSLTLSDALNSHSPPPPSFLWPPRPNYLWPKDD